MRLRPKGKWGRAVPLAGLVVLLAAGAFVACPPERVTRANFYRIAPGMSRAEVEAILGPPGDYRTGLGETASPIDGDGLPDEEWEDTGSEWHDLPMFRGVAKAGTWVGDSVQIHIDIDGDERVLRSTALGRRRTQGAFDGLLWRVHRQWRKWFPE
jgi:hypothetical protein